MKFAEKLKKLRISNEMSQENLAELLNVSRSAIAKWENANGMPDLDNLKMIASIFDVTIDSLIRDEEDIETTEEGFCFKIAGAGVGVGLVLGFLFRDFGVNNMGAWGIGFGIIGYIIGYVIIQIKNK
ncbi:helix-turn-helix domain-containing protein [Anaerofustis stercorihominis]|nr:helix-turn-helix domain-containing protein [Anaerofustis stercorihominis]